MYNYRTLSIEQKIELLKNEIEKIKHEILISEIVYHAHGEDTFEHLFRDNIPLLKEKIKGIHLAIHNLEEELEDSKN
jgi:hypothetical protein